MAARARRLGLALALLFRILLLSLISAIIALDAKVVTLLGLDLSWKDIILIAGGGFLIYKAVGHLHEAVEEDAPGEVAARAVPQFGLVVGQIMVIDVVFSIDSIITAVGLVQQIPVMIAAVILAVGVGIGGAMVVFILLHVYAAIREDIMSRQTMISAITTGDRHFRDDED